MATAWGHSRMRGGAAAAAESRRSFGAPRAPSAQRGSSKFVAGSCEGAWRDGRRGGAGGGREAAPGCRAIVGVDSARGRCLLRNPPAPAHPLKQFFFNGALGGGHSTEHIYKEIACPLVEGVMESYNGTIFACGQTGSRKSFTMQGVADPSSQKVIIPRAFEHIFESVQCAENAKFLLRASYLQIYNEDIRDLLGADTKEKLEGLNVF